jgi:hypothetical protein
VALGEAEIAPLVREWFAVAEPPVNAQGGRVRYDEWGRVVGQVPGGMIAGGPKPDDVGARTSVQYVWEGALLQQVAPYAQSCR